MSYIYIQDNFFEKNIFKEIKNKINTYSYSPPPLKRIKDYGGCYWFEHNLPRGCDVQKVVIKTLQEKMNLSVDEDFKSDNKDVIECESKFIMSNAQDGARPHVDPCQLQCLVFIKGEEITTNGTLFSGDKGVTEKQALKIMDRYEKVGMNLFMLGVQYWNKPHKYNKKKIMVKEGKLNERMDAKKAKTILQQLGANRFIAMTGAKNFAFDSKYMSFKIGRNSKGINHVRIAHNAKDLYDMEFGFNSVKGYKVKKKVKDVYADMLGTMFKKYTGMNVSL